MHPEDFCKQKSAPALDILWSNRPLYQSWGTEPALDVSFDTKLTSFFLLIYTYESCILPHLSAVITRLLQESMYTPPFLFIPVSLHTFGMFGKMAVRTFQMPSPLKNAPDTRDDW